MSDEVLVVPWDAAWPARFEEARARLASRLGDLARGIEHIGSTAVPGLAAKPVIDLLVGVDSLEEADALRETLESDGWIFPEDLNGTISGRRFYKRLDASGVRTHHLHFVRFEGELWDGYVRFRDALRKHPHLRDEYETLKRTLAERYRDQRERYTASKTEFVARVLGLPPESVRTR